VSLDERINDREYFQLFLAERDRRADERLAAQEKATVLAMTELQRRLDTLNHAHEQAREKERDFVGRELYEKQAERWDADVGKLETSVARLQTGGALLAIGIVANLVKLWFA